MRTWLHRMTGILLVLTMTCTMLPVQVFAVEAQAEKMQEPTPVPVRIEAAAVQMDVAASVESTGTGAVMGGDSSAGAVGGTGSGAGAVVTPGVSGGTPGGEPELDGDELRWGDFLYVLSMDEAVITGYKGTDTDLVIPEQLGTLPVTGIGNSAFYGCTALTSVSLPDSVSSIYEYAFQECSGLTQINIPASLTYAGGSIFDGCTALKSVVVPEGVSVLPNNLFTNATALQEVSLPNGLIEIGECAFWGCTSLVNIDVPAGVTKIGNDAFRDCVSLEEVTLPDSVEVIGYHVFENCTSLTTINYPQNLTSCGWSIFGNCDALSKITVPEGVTELPDAVFSHATGLKTVELPSSLRIIGDSAFSECTNLEEISLPDGTETIGGSAFYGCTQLKKVSMPDSVYEIGWYAFQDCTSLTDINYPVNLWNSGHGMFQGCTSLTSITVPEGVTELPDYVFFNATSLKQIKLPSTLEYIGWESFSSCTALESIEIPDGVLEIYNGAFDSCTALAEVTLPDSVEYIGGSAFQNCSNLTDINYPRSLTGADWNIFSGCEKLTYMEVPEGVTALADRVFSGATGLKTVKLPTTLESISWGSFFDCAALDSIAIPDGVTKIGSDAFCGCTALTEVTLPDGVDYIGENAFLNCSNLTTINYPKNLSDVGWNVFSGCEKLTHMEVPEGVINLADQVFSNATGLKTVKLPATLERIGWNAFNGCVSLTSIAIPDGVTEIGASAFCDCTALTQVTLPDSVEFIWGNAFTNCSNLTSINYPKNLDQTSWHIFLGCDKLTHITVPEGVTELPSNVFNGASGLRSVSLPSTLECVGLCAFQDCTNLTSIAIPDRVTLIEDCAFFGCRSLEYVSIANPGCVLEYDAVFESCDKVTIYCELNSLATVYAIKHKIPFIPSYTGFFPDNAVVDPKTSTYVGDLGGAATTGYISFNLDCNILPDAWQLEDDFVLDICIPSGAELVESTLMVNSVLCTDFDLDYNGEHLYLPVTQQQNEISFSVKVRNQDALNSYALIEYWSDRERCDKQEIIGVICENEGIEMFTLETDDMTSSKQIQVKGLAPASAQVTLMIDGTVSKTVTANKVGNYTAVLNLNPKSDRQAFTISGRCTNSDDEELTIQKAISYQQSVPSLTKFYFYVNGSEQPIDLYAASQNGVKPSATYTGSAVPHKFEISFANPERIKAVYVTSTRNNIKTSMEAQYNPKTGKYVAKGLFNDDPAYVPGTISVEYTMDYDVPKVGEAVDWDEYKGYLNTEITKKSVVTKKDETSGTIDLSNTLDSLADTGLDYLIKTYDDSTGSTLNYWKGLAATEANIFSYIVPGMDDSRNLAFFDFRDPNRYLVILSDGVDVASTITEMRLDLVDFGSSGFDNLFDLSNSLSAASTGLSVISSTYGFVKDNAALKSEIMQSSHIQDKWGAMNKADELLSDQVMFTLAATALPLIVASGGVMAGPTLMFGAIVGVMSAMSGLFWELRANQIKGGAFGIKWYIDPSGYVYDVDTNQRLQGVTTTAYYIPTDDSDDFFSDERKPSLEEFGTVWDASEWSQNNPLITDENGCYAWDVPEGWWRVKYEKPGYATVWSDWMPVPPPQTEVNIGMKANFAVKLESQTDTSATVSFTNNTDSHTQLQCVLAVYNDEGKMLSSLGTDLSLNAQSSDRATLTFGADSGALRVKAFILDEDANTPLRSLWSSYLQE